MNIKKIGLSALAGSLAMVSASAVELAVSGQSELTYINEDVANTGNPFGFGNEISFTGTGDVNGMTATYFSTIRDGGVATFASSSLMLDMGDMGTIGFDQGVGSFGVSTIDDKMPYAYEEANYGSGGSNGLRAASGAMNVLGYKNTISDILVSVELNPGSGATANSGTAAATTATGDGGSTGAAGATNSGYNIAVTGSPMDGVNAGIGYGKEESTDVKNAGTGNDEKFKTAYATYAIQGITLGYQRSEGTGGKTGLASNSVEMYGVSFSVNENIAISYNVIDNEYGKVSATDVTEESTGMGASYTMGSASIRAVANKTDNVGGALNTNEEAMEISLMLAF
jgi:outer membrane protein OmpU